MHFLLPSIKCSTAPPNFGLCCLNCANRFDLITVNLAVVESWRSSRTSDWWQWKMQLVVELSISEPPSFDNCLSCQYITVMINKVFISFSTVQIHVYMELWSFLYSLVRFTAYCTCTGKLQTCNLTRSQNFGLIVQLVEHCTSNL